MKVNKSKVQKNSEKFINYNGHLPYLFYVALTWAQQNKRKEFLKKIDFFENEMSYLKYERRVTARKENALFSFISDNPEYENYIIED